MVGRTLAAVSLLLAAACASQPARVPVSESTRTAYQQRCAMCHGDTGDSAARFIDAAWQSQASDDAIKQAILRGGTAIGKDPTMPAHPDLEGTPTLDEMVALIRSFER